MAIFANLRAPVGRHRPARAHRHWPIVVAGAATLLMTSGSALAFAGSNTDKQSNSPDSVRAGAHKTTPIGGVAGVPVPELQWSDAGDAFEKSTAAVPLDYADPTGRTLSLALVRLPATDSAHRRGALFVNFGGPGAEATNTLKLTARTLFSPEVRAAYDIVAVDPPGTGASAPVTCAASTEEQQSLALAGQSGFPTPGNATELASANQQARQIAQGCAARNQDLLSHVGTLRFARDLDVLRAALQSPRLNLYGYSYGTLLGQVAANVFPDRTGAVVLDGVATPDWFTGPAAVPSWNRVNADVGTAQTLAEFFRACDQAGAAQCALAGNAARTYSALAHRLLKQPVSLPLNGAEEPFDYSDLVSISQELLFVEADWPILGALVHAVGNAATDVPDRHASAAAGALITTARARTGAAFTAAHRRTGATRSPNSAGSTGNAGSTVEPVAADYNNYADANWAITCADSPNPGNPANYSVIGQLRDKTVAPYFGSRWASVTRPCAFWSARSSEKWTGPWNSTTQQPILVIGNRFDPATPYTNAVRVNKLLPNSTLLTLNGVGHTSIGTSICVTAAVSQYLLTETTPNPGTVCTQDHGPFDAQPVANGDGQRAVAAGLPNSQ